MEESTRAQAGSLSIIQLAMKSEASRSAEKQICSKCGEKVEIAMSEDCICQFCKKGLLSKLAVRARRLLQGLK
jgi:hypothetical protein